MTAIIYDTLPIDIFQLAICIINMSELNKKIDSFLEKANKAFVHPKKFKFLEHDRGLLLTHEESQLRITVGE